MVTARLLELRIDTPRRRESKSLLQCLGVTAERILRVSETGWIEVPRDKGFSRGSVNRGEMLNQNSPARLPGQATSASSLQSERQRGPTVAVEIAAGEGAT